MVLRNKAFFTSASTFVRSGVEVENKKIEPIDSKIDKAVAFHQRGMLADAERIYREILTLQPNHFDALHLLEVIELQAAQFERATDLIKHAIGINPNAAAAHCNLGKALLELKHPEEALASFNKAIALEPNLAMAHNNRGKAFLDLNRSGEAKASFDKAIVLAPDLAIAYHNRAMALMTLGCSDDALSSCEKAIGLNPNFAEAYEIRGNLFSSKKTFNRAVASYEKAISLKPDFDCLYGMLLHTKTKMCDWSDFEIDIARLVERIERGERAAPPFSLIGATKSNGLQRRAAEIYVSAKYPRVDGVTKDAGRPKRDKIRIGYFSADFYNHATAWLMAAMIENHDRNRFENVAFSFGHDKKDEMRQRLCAAFDKFIDVRNRSDKDVAILSNTLEIDIAVDLKGFTTDNRTGIFAFGAAPIQVNYLGYPGTMGADYIDYLIADATLIPVSERKHFAEKIVYLPNSYQPNDRNRRIADRKFARAEVGLPKDGFIFCCFNNNYKITPDVFDCWVRILKQVNGSVLWLFEDNASAASNLKKEAKARGLDPGRLVFAKLMSSSDHLARQRLADLFLDTLPCNAHTTASDALWAGLPVLTQIGETFAGRVAASLLTAIDVPELIASTRQDYENQAIELATNPRKLAAIKDKLATNRLTTPLFDTALYTKHIEAAYTAMYERYHAGLPPDHIYVPK